MEMEAKEQPLSFIWYDNAKQIKARNIQKRQDILRWLALYYVSLLSVLTIVLSIDARNSRALLKKMLQEKLLRSEKLSSGHVAYGLAPAGIAEIAKFDTDLAKLAKIYQIGRTPISTIPHRINIQMVDLSLSLFGWEDFTPGHLLYKNKGSQVPDLIADDPNGLVVALEVELNVKSTKRMKVVCEQYAELVDYELDPCIPFQRILYLTPYVDRLNQLLDDLVPREKRHFFEVDMLWPVPILLTPRRNHKEGK